MCKQIVTPNPNEPSRNCRSREFADGWCKLHHPDTVEGRLMRELVKEQWRIQESENLSVGTFLRNKHPALFEQVFVELVEARENWKIRKSET